MLARPRVSTVYFYNLDLMCTIACHPQQRWGYAKEGNKVTLRRGNVIMEISKETFDKEWIEVKQ